MRFSVMLRHPVLVVPAGGKLHLLHALPALHAGQHSYGLELLIDKALSGFRPYGGVLGVPLAGALVLERSGFAVLV